MIGDCCQSLNYCIVAIGGSFGALVTAMIALFKAHNTERRFNGRK